MSRSTAATILLVEDNETIRHAFSILLEDSGYRVLQAGTGEEALRVAKRDDPDLILMDLGLPDLNGLEVTKRLKADPDTARGIVVALTGRALETNQAECLSAGCAAYIAKPIDSENLLRTIPELLAREG